MQLVDGRGRLLNHLETVYRPGEMELARRSFEALGCKVHVAKDFLTVSVDPNKLDGIDTVIYSSKVTREQWAFETALAAEIEAGGGLSDAWHAYAQKLVAVPQRSFHFGIRFASMTNGKTPSPGSIGMLVAKRTVAPSAEASPNFGVSMQPPSTG